MSPSSSPLIEMASAAMNPVDSKAKVPSIGYFNGVGEDTLYVSATNGVQAFIGFFDREVFRVAEFINTEQRKLEFAAKSLLTQAEEADTSTTTTSMSIFALREKMEDFVDSCLKLQSFVNEQVTVFKTVAEKADKEFKTTCALSLEQRVPKTNLNSVLTVVASDIYRAIQKTEKKLENNGQGNNQDEVWQAPSSFKRATTKYWIKDDQLTTLMLGCSGEAPLLIYGMKLPLTSKENRLSRQSEGDKLWDKLATPITSVYFDSTDMSLYKKRLARVEGAQLLRVRWYGSKKPTGNKPVFLELKTHHEDWVENSSEKERVTVRECDMPAFLVPEPWTTKRAHDMVLQATPTLQNEELAKQASLLYRMHRLVVKHQLGACIRSVYMRAAFQSPKNNDLRLTLDRNVTLVDERCRPSGSWCLPDDAVTQASTRSMVVPFNVFEVKVAGKEVMPASIKQMITDRVIEEAPKFSKFLTGAAMFNRVQTLPYWANHPAFASKFGVGRSQQENSSHIQASSIDPCDMCYHLMPTFGTNDASSQSTKGMDTPNKGLAIAEKKPVRVEPKSFFANERTFISWIHAALLLLTVSTIMMGDGQYLGTAALTSFSALVLVCYAAFVYFRRINLLSAGKGAGYVDHLGPMVLAIGVSIGVCIVFIDLARASGILNFEGITHDDDDDRRLSSNARRLAQLPAVYEESGNCIQQSMNGINRLKFQPRDMVMDTKRDELVVASQHDIFSHPLHGRTPSHLAKIVDAEIGGLSLVGDRMFALSGGPKQTELLELTWTSVEGDEMTVENRWNIRDSVSEVGGMTFVSGNSQISFDGKEDESSGQLYIDIDGLIDSYEVPSRDTTSLTLLDSINMKLINQGLGDGEDIAAMHSFEGVTYLLHSKLEVLHAWDLDAGEFLAEIPLPHLDTGLSEQWTGLSMERVSSSDQLSEEGSKSLRGASRSPSSSLSSLFLHLTTDTPPQIWSFRMKEDGVSRSSIRFPECAGAAASAT